MAIRFIDEQAPAQAPQQANVYGAMGDVFSKRWGRVKEDIKNPNVPRKIIRTLGDLLGAIPEAGIEAFKPGMKAVKNVATRTGALPAAAAINKATGLNRLGGAIQEKVGSAAQAHPEAARDVMSVADIIAGIPAVGPAVGTALKVAGRTTKGIGKAALLGEMKIKPTLAREAAKSTFKGKRNIVSGIEKYKLESPAGGYPEMVEKAQAAISERMEIASDVLKGGMREHPGTPISFDREVVNFRSKIESGNAGIPFDQKKAAIQKLEDISASLKEDFGSNAAEPMRMSLDMANQARKKLEQGVFKKGPFQTPTDPLGDQIKEGLSRQMIERLGGFIPAQRQANREISELITIKRALEDASAGTEGHNLMASMGGGIMAGMGGLAGAFGGEPTLGAVLGYAGHKVARKGRGGSLAIKAGRAGEKAGQKVIDYTTLPELIGRR